jgi:hypothetical protein
MGKPEFRITGETGNKILEWCNSGVNVNDVRQMINVAVTIEELSSLYSRFPEWYPMLKEDFTRKKSELQSTPKANQIIYLNQNSSSNGINNANKTR